MNAMAHLFLAMGLGTLVSGFLNSLGLIFPAYIGSMVVAAVIRNIADFTHVYNMYIKCIREKVKFWAIWDSRSS